MKDDKNEIARLKRFIVGMGMILLVVLISFVGYTSSQLKGMRSILLATSVQNVEPLKPLNGQDGKDGKTPIKGIDYVDGTDGRDGLNGSTTVIQQPTVERIIERPLSFTDLTPTQITLLKGKDGFTPRKGVDYNDGKNGREIQLCYLLDKVLGQKYAGDTECQPIEVVL